MNEINEIYNFFLIECKKYIDNIPNFFPKPSVVFDIDGTILDEQGNCICPIIELYKYVQKKRMIPIIITSRLETQYVRNYTYNQLLKCGINNNYLFLRPEGYNFAKDFKEDVRKFLAQNGYNIIMSIGDMPSDFGNYGGLGILLPGYHKQSIGFYQS